MELPNEKAPRREGAGLERRGASKLAGLHDYFFFLAVVAFASLTAAWAAARRATGTRYGEQET
jgi:hypothetical protein